MLNIYSYGLFCFLGIIWGTNFMYMKFASEYITAEQLLFIRVFCGFIAVFIYALIKKSLNIRDLKNLPHFIVMSVLATNLYFYCFIKGTSLLMTGIAGAISSVIPLCSFLLAVIFIKEENITIMRFLGILFGLIGVVLITYTYENRQEISDFSGIYYILIGSFSLGSSFVYAKKYLVNKKIKAEALTTYQLGISLISLLLIVNFDGIDRILVSSEIFWQIVIGLGILGTGIAYIIYYYIVGQFGAIIASSVTYIPPVVALIIGYLFLNENIKLLDLFATILIFIGVFFVNKNK